VNPTLRTLHGRKTLKKLALIIGLAAVSAGGATLAEAKGPGHERPDATTHNGGSANKGRAKRCAKPRKVGFVVKGTFVSGDAVSVTLKVVKANRHAVKSGLVTVGDDYTATPSKPSRIRYVNRTGPTDAQPTDKVRVAGKVTALKRGCSADGFTPTASVRKVMVIGPESTATTPNPGDAQDPGEGPAS
jgi:hypothetical protein